ncbi:hypothetical protein AB0C69_11000 [Actinomadura sp. NPDC048032]|uniref:hypothetical protein n=1 Tax=Actinomadura sp. NPDC048032 TaxID=3155747 RepID=UPI0033CF1A21
MSDEQTNEQTESAAEQPEATEVEETDERPEGEAKSEGDKPLGPAGEKALQAEKERRRKAAQELREAKAEIQRLRNGGDEAAQKAAEVEKAALAKANTRIVRAEVKAAAAGRLANPALAMKLLDLDKFEVDDNGDVDQGEIADAISELLREEPYLAAEAPKRFQGGADQGARKKAKPASLDERIAEAESKGDWAEARRLKSSKLTQSA